MLSAHIFVFGFVQGVGYRHFVKRRATELGLTGWVKNMPDRRVEAVFQGEKGKIEEMIKFCKKGPFLSEVEDVEVEWEKREEKYSGFDIVI